MAGDRAPKPVQRAEDWIDDKTAPAEGRPKGLEDVDGVPTVGELRREQQRETSGAALAHTGAQAHGATAGAIAFGAIGLLVGIVLGLVLFDGDSPGRYVLPVVVTVFAGWVGLVYWGGRTPELEGETLTATGEPNAGTTLRDPGTDERGR